MTSDRKKGAGASVKIRSREELARYSIFEHEGLIFNHDLPSYIYTAILL